jgi:hypothetical protein
MKTRVLVIAAAAAALSIGIAKRGARPVEAAASTESRLLIRFGLDGKAGVDWSGSLEAAAARLSGWQFDPGDRIDGLSWTCTPRLQSYWDTPYEAEMKGTSRRDKVTGKGVVVTLGAADQQVRVKTRQGDFTVGSATTVDRSPVLFLDGRVSVQAVPAAAPLTSDDATDDYPAMAEASDGALWLAWQAFDGLGDQVWVKRLRNGAWSAPEPLATSGGDYFRTAIAQDGAGRIHVVWSAQAGGNFDLWERVSTGKSWSRAARLTLAENSDIHHVMAAAPDGRAYLAWQSARAGNFDIWMRIFDGRAWGPEMQVSTSPANDWEPSLAIAPNGAVTVVWDTYDVGNHDVVARTWVGREWGPVTPLAATGAFESRASAAYDRKGRLWVAYDEGDHNWGKDFGFRITGAGRGLLDRRQVRVIALDGGRVLHAPTVEGAVPEDLRQVFQRPNLAIDAQDRPWLLFRSRVNLPMNKERGSFRAMWRLYSTTWRDGRWTPAAEFTSGYGRIDMPAAMAPSKASGVAVAWASDGRVWPAGRPLRQDLNFAVLPGAGELPPLREAAPAADNPPPVHAREREDLERIRAWRAQAGGQILRIARGDLHRHTDLSWDGNRDGSLDDSYRYALDAAGFDYLGVCDHQAGESIPYNWWRLQKAVDLYTIRDRFAPLYSYERSLSWPNGHRNVFFATRGRPVLEVPEAEARGEEGAARLYAYLRRLGGLASSHTSATGAGTDWRDSDADIEPVVEIYQGYRSSYEGPNAPRSPNRKEVERFAAGFVWNAWAKGIKLGVQGSSDHVSTHVSYASFYVDRIDRQAMLDAMRARRVYAATDNVIVETRLGGRFMGGIVTAAVPGPLSVYVRGTAPLAQVEVIRANQVVYGAPVSGAEARFEWTDQDPAGGDTWYYVRVRQQDGQLAWSSPIWFRKSGS